MTIGEWCIAALGVIAVVAAVWNDIRQGTLARALVTTMMSVKGLQRRLDTGMSTELWLQGEQSKMRLRCVDLERGHHATNSKVAELERKVVGLEGRELRRIFAERLADGTFHHARPAKRKRNSTSKGRRRA